MRSVYPIHQRINHPIVFKGLKAQWIWWMGGVVVLLLLLFAILYVSGIALIFCVLLVMVMGAGLFALVYSFSNRYGAFGLMKHIARKSVPKGLKGCSSISVGKSLSNENSKRNIANLGGGA